MSAHSSRSASPLPSLIDEVKKGVQESVNILVKTNYDNLAVLQEGEYEKNLQIEQMATYCRRRLDANIQGLIRIAVRKDATGPFKVDLEQIPAPPHLTKGESSVAAVDVDGDVDVGEARIVITLLGIFAAIAKVAAGVSAAAVATEKVAKAAKAIKSLSKSNKDKDEFEHPAYAEFDQPSGFWTPEMIAADLLKLKETIASFVEDRELPASVKAYFE